MADTKLYLRPIGLLYGATASAAMSSGLALPLAGGPIAFTAAELFEGTPRKAKRRLFPAKDLEASRDADLKSLLERVTTKRSHFAGIAMDEPVLMGIVNVTPDSFSDGGLYDTKEGAITQAATLAREGAAIVDIGGESTRPGSDAVEGGEELSRVVPVIEGLKGFGAAISIDTRKASVARAAAKAGTKIFNDVSALTYDPDSLKVAKETGMDVVLMHAKGEPKTMQDDPRYDDVVLEVYDYLEERVQAATDAGVGLDKIAIDPGIGFGKTIAHNLALMANLTLFHGLGVPILVGASRKRFIGEVSQKNEPRLREPGSYAAAIAAASQGAQMLRVHDVAGNAQALEVWRLAVSGEPEKG
jgi:dihydropteroate synthase